MIEKLETSMVCNRMREMFSELVGFGSLSGKGVFVDGELRFKDCSSSVVDFNRLIEFLMYKI